MAAAIKALAPLHEYVVTTSLLGSKAAFVPAMDLSWQELVATASPALIDMQHYSSTPVLSSSMLQSSCLVHATFSLLALQVTVFLSSDAASVTETSQRS